MSTNISKQKREDLLTKIKEIRTFISAAPQDENTGNLLSYLSELEKDVCGKKYGLVFEEHREEIDEVLATHTPVLTEQSDLYIANGGEMNFLIEGDNLASLKLLEKTHKGKIDLIYIDPPYNTGNKDFVYDDCFVNSDDLFSHSKWISFMEVRLEIAKRLLKNEGIIFLSIGDAELADLKLLCDEIFGEINCLSIVPRLMKTGGNKGRFFSPNIDYVLVYAKNQFSAKDFKGELDEEIVKKLYNKIETDGIRKGERYRPFGLYQSSLDERPNQRYYIECPDGTFVIPPGETMPLIIADGEKVLPNKGDGCWRWSQERYLVEKANGNILFTPSKSGVLIQPDGSKSKWNVYTKIWLSNREEEGQTPTNFIGKYENRHSAKELKDIGVSFDFAKPTGLISYLFNLTGADKNAVCLDFFAGSGTMGHAVMKLNAEDGGNRKFILCTNNENGICENVTYERNKRVIEGYKKPSGEEVAGLSDNNLRYYRTEFLPRERSVKNMRELVQASTGLLCIKNDLYTEASFGGRKMNPTYARYFEHAGQRMLVIYEERAIPFIADIIKTMPEGEKIKVYVFSHGSYAYDDEFAEVAEQVTLCALPQAIYDAYQKVLPKRKPKFLVDELVEEIVENNDAEETKDGLFGLDYKKGGDQ